MRTRDVLAAFTLLAATSAAAESDYSAKLVTHADPKQQLLEQLDLYDRLCLRLFPDDAALEADLRNRGARAMTPAELKVLLHDDPGTGWVLAGRTATFRITVEGPPYHACSVRTMTAAGYADLAPYRTLRDRYEKDRDFSRSKPMDMSGDGVRSHLEADQRLLAGGVWETLMVADVRVADAKAVADGLTNVEVRFVHQIVSPPDAPTS